MMSRSPIQSPAMRPATYKLIAISDDHQRYCIINQHLQSTVPLLASSSRRSQVALYVDKRLHN